MASEAHVEDELTAEEIVQNLELDDTTRDQMTINGELMSFEDSMRIMRDYMAAPGRSKVYPRNATQKDKAKIRKRAKHLAYNPVMETLWKKCTKNTKDPENFSGEYIFFVCIFVDCRKFTLSPAMDHVNHVKSMHSWILV